MVTWVCKLCQNPRERGTFSGSRVTQAHVPAHSLPQAAKRVALALQGWMGLLTVHHQSLSPMSQNVQRETVFSPLTQRSQGLQWINKEIALGYQLPWSGQVPCSGGAHILRGPRPSAQWEQDPRDKQSIACVRMNVCSHPTWLPQVVTAAVSVEDRSFRHEQWKPGVTTSPEPAGQGQKDQSSKHSELEASQGYTVRACIKIGRGQNKSL